MGCTSDCYRLRVRSRCGGTVAVEAGSRVRTDRRDAAVLTRLHRAGELTPLWISDAAHEAMRDSVRARATVMIPIKIWPVIRHNARHSEWRETGLDHSADMIRGSALDIVRESKITFWHANDIVRLNGC